MEYQLTMAMDRQFLQGIHVHVGVIGTLTIAQMQQIVNHTTSAVSAPPGTM